MKKLLFLTALLFVLSACAMPAAKSNLPDIPLLVSITNTDIKSDRKGDVLTAEFTVDNKEAKFSAELDDSGKNVLITTPLKGIFRLKYELSRPLVSVEEIKSEDGGYFIKLKLALKCRMVRTDTETGFMLTFYLLEPDTELLAMQTFGSWMRPSVAASRLVGVKNNPSSTVLTFDNIPVYSTGSNGGAGYADIYNVRIPAGNVKYSKAVSVDIRSGKSRITFKGPAEICVQGAQMTIGRSCAGYLSLFGMAKEKSEGKEKFMFRLTGRPEISVKTLKGVTAFGIKDVKLFGTGLLRFEGDAVFKTEMRQSGGLAWIVFVHDPEYKFRRFYSSGDVLNVVFYKG